MGQGFRDLIAWQKAIRLVTSVYEITSKFPPEERFGLTSQMRRAAVSIPSNIAEGHGRQSIGEFRLFVGHARGSLAELETQIEIAMNLRMFGGDQDDAYCSDRFRTLQEQTSEVGRILNGLLSSLRDRAANTEA